MPESQGSPKALLYDLVFWSQRESFGSEKEMEGKHRNPKYEDQ